MAHINVERHNALEAFAPMYLAYGRNNGGSFLRPAWWSVTPSTDTFTALARPSNPLNITHRAMQWQPSDNYLVGEGGSTTPYVGIYKRTDTTMARLTSGVPTWSAATGAINAVQWTSDDHFLVGGTAAPFIQAATRSGDTFTLVGTPVDVQPLGKVEGMAWSSVHNHLIIADGGASIIKAYTKSGSAFTQQATTFALPVTTTRVAAIAFNPAQTHLAIVCDTVPTRTIRTYTVSGGVYTFNSDKNFAGTIGTHSNLVYSPNGKFMYTGNNTGTGVRNRAFTISGNTYTEIVTPGYRDVTTANACYSVSPDSKYLAMSQASATAGVGNLDVYSINQTTGVLTFLFNAGDSGSADNDAVAFNNRLFL